MMKLWTQDRSCLSITLLIIGRQVALVHIWRSISEKLRLEVFQRY